MSNHTLEKEAKADQASKKDVDELDKKVKNWSKQLNNWLEGKVQGGTNPPPPPFGLD